MTKAPKHYVTKDGLQHAIIPSRADRRTHWRSERAKFREPGVKPRQQATDEWRASWQALRGDM